MVVHSSPKCVYFQHAQRHLTRKPEFVNVPERLKEGKANLLTLLIVLLDVCGQSRNTSF